MRPSIPFVALAVAALATVVALGAGAAAVLAYRRPQWTAVDATPADVRSGRVEVGQAVWLRGMRDRSRPVRLPGGRTLYPCESEPGVMVDCTANGCAGPLIGRLSRETLPAPLVPEGSAGSGRPVWVVQAGVQGDRGRHWLQLAGAVGLGAVLVALGAGAVAFAARRRGR